MSSLLPVSCTLRLACTNSSVADAGSGADELAVVVDEEDDEDEDEEACPENEDEGWDIVG